MLIKKIYRTLKRKEIPLVKVYSHPRSGTHFMEAFLARNIYQGKDLSIVPITWGHWSNRKLKKEGNPYGKLFGNHYFADRNNNNAPKIYMQRDGRAVAYSIWKTPNFLHPDLKGISFSEFLRTNIDWYGTPSKQVEPSQTILEHWVAHLDSWQSLAKENPNVLIINYEDLIDAPYEQYKKIYDTFFKEKKQLKPEQLDVIKDPLGLLPNKGKKNSWKNALTKEDNDWCQDLIPNHFYVFKNL